MTVIFKKDKAGRRMTPAKLIANARGHWHTVSEHRKKVFEHCVRAGIPFRGLVHDLSKYCPGEFIYGVLYYQGDRSPNEGEREDYGFSYAWMHHKGRNKHHFEYWTDYDPVTRKMSPVKMPVRYVKEMFCDRVAASKIYNGKKYTDAHPYEYFLRVKGKRRMHEKTEAMLEKLLVMLRDEGEEKTFAYIKSLDKKDRR